MTPPDQTVQQPAAVHSPSLQQPQPQQEQSNTNNTSVNNSPANVNGQVKRKPSRRANTAERRATHNAVERQRRETLNGRFLDLAALLPNLSQIRRPSKSSIVNSSIAHIHASRRHRMLASRELRLLKLESDALRREVNEWRSRAGIPSMEEPVRSDSFSMVISGELEVLTGVQAEEEDDDFGLGGYDGEDDTFGPGHIIPPGSSMPNGGIDALEDPRMAMLKNHGSFSHGVPAQHAHHAHHNSSNGLHLSHILSRPTGQNPGPMIASPTTIAYENPALPAMYDGHSYPGPPFVQSQQSHSMQSLDSEKIAAWNAAQMYHGQHNQMMQQRSMFTTPPSSSHSMSSGSPGHSSTSGSVSPRPQTSSSSPISTDAASHFNDPGFYNVSRPQQQMIGHPPYGSPSERDDTSSISSNRSHGDADHEQQFRQKTSIAPAVSSVRDRSGSSGVNMAASGASMPSSGNGSYELGSGQHGEYAVNMHRRRATHSGIWARDGDIAMGGMNVGIGIGVNVGMNAVTVGGAGGGNGNGFAMMM